MSRGSVIGVEMGLTVEAVEECLIKHSLKMKRTILAVPGISNMLVRQVCLINAFPF